MTSKKPPRPTRIGPNLPRTAYSLSSPVPQLGSRGGYQSVCEPRVPNNGTVAIKVWISSFRRTCHRFQVTSSRSPGTRSRWRPTAAGSAAAPRRSRGLGASAPSASRPHRGGEHRLAEHVLRRVTVLALVASRGPVPTEVVPRRGLVPAPRPEPGGVGEDDEAARAHHPGDLVGDHRVVRDVLHQVAGERHVHAVVGQRRPLGERDDGVTGRAGRAGSARRTTRRRRPSGHPRGGTSRSRNRALRRSRRPACRQGPCACSISHVASSAISV